MSTSNGLHPTLKKESMKTIADAISKLASCGKVFICRPTGFGKTYMLTRIAKHFYQMYPDKRIAYIYPLDIIQSDVINKYGKNDSDPEIREIVTNKIDFISYSKMTREYNKYGEDYWKEEFKNKYSILLLDEVHSAGSENFRAIYNGFKELIDNKELFMVGVTATPNRMDDTLGNSVLESIFDNVCTYEYGLADCIEDGIIDKLVIATRKYDMVSLANDLKTSMKNKCKSKKIQFDDEAFNVELGKMLKESGTEAEMILKYIQLAGYDLRGNDSKYFKFIVFFNNISDVANKGPMIERWFNEAFNKVAFDKGLVKHTYKIRSHYLTSSDTEYNEISKTVKEKDTRYKYRDTNKLLRQNLKQEYCIDLILTVNMTNMGYHDDDINGIMMLRGTRSEIIYYQQLGRAISVKSKHRPLIFDFVNNVNTKFWFKKDRIKTIEKGLLSGSRERNSDVDYSNFIANIEGDYDAFDDFMNRWSDEYYSVKASIAYMYKERKAPIVVIAADISKSCMEVVKELIGMNIELRPEDAMFYYEKLIANSDKSSKDDKVNANIIIHCLNSKDASEYSNRLTSRSSLYARIIKLIK